MNIGVEFSSPGQIDLSLPSARRSRFYRALVIFVSVLALAGISGVLLVRPEGEWISGERTFTGEEYERFERLRMAADMLARKRMAVSVYDNLIRRHSEDRGYTPWEKEGWKKEILRHKEEFNAMARVYNDRMTGTEWATRAEGLPRGTQPLPQRFELYGVP
ncbi:hypothetical protein HYY27_06305 [bacterium]|nr:hypothetical protein [bacterium]